MMNCAVNSEHLGEDGLDEEDSCEKSEEPIEEKMSPENIKVRLREGFSCFSLMIFVLLNKNSLQLMCTTMKSVITVITMSYSSFCLSSLV